MRITDFEKNFLGIDGGNDEFNPYVIRLFHTLLQKVERDPYRKWTHDLLRNYVNASYYFCSNLNDIPKVKIASQDAKAIRKAKIASQEAKSKEQKEQEKQEEQEEKNESPQVNLYEDYDTNLKVFFTGLYTPGTYQGLKNGLYFVINPSVEPKISVKTRKEIFEADQKEIDGEKVLRQIDHRDSFENELVGVEDLNINKISLLDKMSPEDTNEIIKKKSINDEIKGNPWLHILRDGIDNLPTDFVLSFFNKWYEVPSPVDRYKNRKIWIEECIKHSCSNNEDNSFMYYQEIMLDTMQAILDKSNIHNLPVYFYIKESTYNYLLPMYLLNSGKPDFCIVLKHMKDMHGKYTGTWEPVTSLDMDEVYCNIRVFGKDAIERVRDWW